jgi:hypothetical protein
LAAIVEIGGGMDAFMHVGSIRFDTDVVEGVPIIRRDLEMERMIAIKVDDLLDSLRPVLIRELVRCFEDGIANVEIGSKD